MSRTNTILVVDDEPAVCIALEGILKRDGYRVLTALNASEALQKMQEEDVDLALLDLNMPGMHGLELMRQIKERWPLTIVMILTGYGTLESALAALRQGAHDYLLKPANPEAIRDSVRRGLEKRREALKRHRLLARIREDVMALTRDRETTAASSYPTEVEGEEEQSVISVGELFIDLQRHRVIWRGREVSLTPTEFNLLVTLARQPGRVLSCATLVREVQGYECEESEARAIVKTHVSHLRQKLEEDSSHPRHLLNVRGVGYMWSPEGKE